MGKEKITIQIDNEIIELKGTALEAFVADREAIAEAERLIEAEQTAKAKAREKALKKLADLGLTEEEIAAIL